MNSESFIQVSRDIYQEDLHKKLHEQFLKNTIVYTNQQFLNILLFENEDRVVTGYVFPIVIHGDWLASFVLFESRETITENDIRIMDAFRNYFVHRQTTYFLWFILSLACLMFILEMLWNLQQTVGSIYLVWALFSVSVVMLFTLNMARFICLRFYSILFRPSLPIVSYVCV